MSAGDHTLDDRLLVGCLGLALFVSPGGQVFLPWDLGAVPNLGVALVTLALGRAAFPLLWPVPSGFRKLLSATLALALWGAVASAASPFPSTSLRFWTKGVLYGAFFWVLLSICRRASARPRVEMTLLAFLAVLAVLGLVETVAPRLPLFSWLRVPHSLRIQPRIASVLSWPNTFGALMVMGLCLTESLRSASRLGDLRASALSSMFVILSAQSGSRNAWVALAVALPLLVVRRQLGIIRGSAIASFFGLCLLCLPVARWQTSLVNFSRPPLPRDKTVAPKPEIALSDPITSLSQRSVIWAEGRRLSVGRPWTGIGLGVFSSHLAPVLPGNTRNPNLHSLPLNVLVEMGVPGLICGLVWLQIVLAGSTSTAAVALMVALSAQLFDNFLYDPSFVLVFLSLCAVTAGHLGQADGASDPIDANPTGSASAPA